MPALYSLKLVSQKTGLSAQLIRTWETRYKAVTPMRRPNNRRVYSEDDLARLTHLSHLVQAGHSIGLIANLPLQTLINLGDKRTLQSHKSPEDWISNALSLIQHQELDLFDSELTQLGENHPDVVIIESYLTPLMHMVGEKWANNELRIADEHLASAVVRNFLTNRLKLYESKKNSPLILCGILEDQLHEFGSLSIAILSASMNWRTLHFGSYTPLTEIATTALQNKAAAVAISLCSNSNSKTSAKHILNLRHLLPSTIDIVVGGSGLVDLPSSIQENGIHLVSRLQDFKRFILDAEDKIRRNSNA